MMIASGFLLAGGLLALRYPADRESETPATTAAVVVGRNVLPSSSPTLQEQASIASPSGAGSSFEPIEAFVRRTDRRDDMPTHAGSGDWYPTSMSEPNDSANGGMSHNDAETRTLDRRTYAAMPVDSTLEQTVPPMPEYRPFLVASPVTMPEANPAFFAEPPTPPNLTGLAKTSDIFGEAVPGHIISPSATTQPSVPVTGV
ncbi:MAG: hypothetical protein FWD31_09530, partial [Planctomycetaceae bacterium]|nr:hypothetical protein [Planctomycetaceae bacterium]